VHRVDVLYDLDLLLPSRLDGTTIAEQLLRPAELARFRNLSKMAERLRVPFHFIPNEYYDEQTWLNPSQTKNHSFFDDKDWKVEEDTILNTVQ